MKAIYLPLGPKNLEALFPTINLRDVDQYFIEIKADETVVGTSNTVKLESCDDHVRIHFLNQLGCIDAVNFHLFNVEMESKSATFERSLSYPLVKTNHSINRYNVSSEKMHTARTVSYEEEQLIWLEELFNSPLAWIEQKGIQGQPDTYTPILIQDQKLIERKDENRFVYEIEIKYTLSNNPITLRN